jgi:hypothetical protein
MMARIGVILSLLLSGCVCIEDDDMDIPVFQGFNPVDVTLIKSEKDYDVYAYYINQFNADASLFFNPVDYSIKDIAAIAIGNRSAWDSVEILAPTGPYAQKPLIVGSRQPYLGPFPDKFRMQGRAKYVPIAGDIFPDNSFELELLFYTRGSPPLMPQRRDTLRRNFSAAVGNASDQHWFINTTGRDGFKVAYQVSTAAASTCNVNIWGHVMQRTVGGVNFTTRTQLSTVAIPAATTTVTHFESILHFDMIEVELDMTAGTVNQADFTLLAWEM